MTGAWFLSLARLGAWLSCLGLGSSGCVCVDAPTPQQALSDASTAPYPEVSVADPWKDQHGPHTLEDRGLLLGCSHATTFTKTDISHNPLFQPALGPATNGYELFVMQYVSEARPGVARAVTALLYLPSGGPTNVPIVAVDHSTSGLGPSCGPSHAPSVTDALAVALVGRGYAVIAPDYAGMGVDNGMTSYLVGAAEAAATLDAIRALRTFHDPRFDAAQLGTDFFVAGYSQGGHAALFTHQLFDPSIGVRLLGSIALAPGLSSAREWSVFFKGHSRPVGGIETFALMSLYARMLYTGSPEPGAWLSPSAQALLPTLFHDQCLSSLVYSVPANYPTLGDLYQPSFLAAADGCTFDGKCPNFEPWASGLLADEPGAFTSNVPSLVLQGLSDVIVPPSTVACIVDRMKAHGTPVQACGYVGDDHSSIVGSAVPAMIRWIDARRTGGTPDVCSAPLDVACSAP